MFSCHLVCKRAFQPWTAYLGTWGRQVGSATAPSLAAWTFWIASDSVDSSNSPKRSCLEWEVYAAWCHRLNACIPSLGAYLSAKALLRNLSTFGAFGWTWHWFCLRCAWRRFPQCEISSGQTVRPTQPSGTCRSTRPLSSVPPSRPSPLQLLRHQNFWREVARGLDTLS